MSASHPLLKLASRGAVALWIGVYLAAPVLRPAPEAPLAPETASARLKARPAPEPERAPEPPPAPPEPRAEPARAEPEPAPAATAAAPATLGPAEVAAGDRILDGGGAFPVLSCTYEDFPSFDAYARAMVGLGARFVVVKQRKIVAAVDPATGSFREDPPAGRFSPRARDYTGEPGLASLSRAARERFGPGAVVMMLVPRQVDAALFGGIARALASRGDHHESYREIRGRYQRAAGGGLRLRVDRATRADGGEVPMELVFDLAQVSGA